MNQVIMILILLAQEVKSKFNCDQMKAIIFAVDEVLVDSLAPHVKLCQDINKR